MIHRLGRTELYELVWSQPMIRLAERFGMSDVGLAKACRRAGIPVPPRGYWAKVQHGRPVSRVPLPPARSGAPEPIVIHASGPRLPEPRPEPPPPVPEPAAAESEPEQPQRERPIRAAKTLSNPHPIVAAWLEQERRLLDPWGRGRRVARRLLLTPLERRRYLISSALFRALEARGFTLSVDLARLREVSVSRGAAEIDFTLREHVRQYRRELTKAERKELFNLNRKWIQVREPTGKLVLRIDSLRHSTIPHEWRDHPDRPLEVQLDAIVGGFAAAAKELHEQYLADREAQRRYAEAEYRRRKQEERRRHEAERLQGLLRSASAWQKATELRAYVHAVQSAVEPTLPETRKKRLTTWVSWALAQADHLDPVASGRWALGRRSAKSVDAAQDDAPLAARFADCP